MKEGPGSVYDKWNISMVICDTGDFNFGEQLATNSKNLEAKLKF
jgi:hypothetical protein